jgi:hypothetical protein
MILPERKETFDKIIRQDDQYVYWLQWGTIAVINIIALLNYLEITPFLYTISLMEVFEFLLRNVFSDVIAFSVRKNRKFPFIWWLFAFFFPLVTLFYIYFLPFDEKRQEIAQRKLDAGFVVVCVIIWVIHLLYTVMRH